MRKRCTSLRASAMLAALVPAALVALYHAPAVSAEGKSKAMAEMASASNTLTLGSPAQACTKIIVECEVALVMQDHFEDAEHYGYGLCQHPSNHGDTLILNINPKKIIEANLFETNQLVKIEVQTGACSPPSEAVYKDVRSHSRAPFDGPVYDLVRTLSAPPDRNRRAVVAHGPRDVLIIRVNYNGVSPAYCDEDCIKQNMWATKGNSINGLFTDASYGKVTFPQALSKVVTVNIEGGIYAKASICKFWEIGLEADKAVREQFDLEPNDYSHRSYVLPLSISSCRFGGLGYVGCKKSKCKTWIRQNTPLTLAHELGHNLGIWHSSTDTNDDGNQDSEYGDNSCIMGNAKNWRGLNAPHRLALNWIEDANVKTLDGTCESSGIFNLAALSRVPGSMPDHHTVIKFARAQGGNYYISFRASEGYDSSLSSLWANRVSIHYHYAHTTSKQTNSEIVSVLRAGMLWRAPQQTALFAVLHKNPDLGSVTVGIDFCGKPTQIWDKTTAMPIAIATAPNESPTIAAPADDESLPPTGIVATMDVPDVKPELRMTTPKSKPTIVCIAKPRSRCDRKKKSNVCCSGMECVVQGKQGNKRCMVIQPPKGQCFEAGKYCTKRKHCCNKLCNKKKSKCMPDAEYVKAKFMEVMSDDDGDDDDGDARARRADHASYSDDDDKDAQTPSSMASGVDTLGAFIAGAICAAMIAVVVVVTVSRTGASKRDSVSDAIENEAGGLRPPHDRVMALRQRSRDSLFSKRNATR